jgi:hypothetical protein
VLTIAVKIIVVFLTLSFVFAASRIEKEKNVK